MADTTIAENRTTRTPGPWHWYGRRAIEAKDETVLVGDCGLPSCGRTELFVSDANALLIAAAPDLYAVLREAVDAFDARTASGDVLPPSVDVADRVARARAVLAKVEGK